MEYEIVWTLRATKDVEVSLSYLENEWSEKVAREYFVKLKEVISLVSKFPYSFPLFINERKIRRCPVTKHNTVYFKIAGTEVVVLTVFDSRRNPESLLL